MANLRFCLIVLSLVVVAVSGDTVLRYKNFNKFFRVDKERQDNGDEKHWALIVAGSNGYFNYRHQADACHAYQIMKKHGIPDERIVVMMYDDIANNEENPMPGKIINRPDGPDVYAGVPKDYTKEDVTPENFLNILQGNEAAMSGIGSGKVIKSGPNDHVFVNFVDHGAPGLIAFPSSELHASQLMNAIQSMHEANKYKQMVFYIEACESGSMMENLPDDVKVYATTAANAHESSYACYYDRKLRTYLGDVYSVKWMEDSDKENLNVETLEKQFHIVKEETNTSHVQEFGDKDIANEPVADFQARSRQHVVSKAPIKFRPVQYDAVSVEGVKLRILEKRLRDEYDLNKRSTLRKQIMDELEVRRAVRSTMKAVAGLAARSHTQATEALTGRHKLTRTSCYEPAVAQFKNRCFNFNKVEYALRHLYVLVNLCEQHVSLEVLTEAMSKVCDAHKFNWQL